MGNKGSEKPEKLDTRRAFPTFLIQENRAHIYDVSHNTDH